MHVYQSILYLVLHQGNQDQIAVGYLLSDNRTTLLQLSQNKIDAVIKFFSPTQQILVKQEINHFKEIFNIKNGVGYINADLVGVQKLHEWSIYKNNLFSFLQPQIIDIQLNTDNLNTLFKTLINAYEQREVVEKNEKPNLKKIFYPKIKHHVNINFTLTTNNLPTLFTPTHLNFIGQKGVPVIGKEIDFDKRNYNLEKDLQSIYVLQAAFKAQQTSPVFFLIGNEPEKNTHAKQHQLWQNIRQQDLIKVVPIDEVAAIETYLNDNDVLPFS